MQTQLLPIQVLPIQTIPIQAIQPPAGENQPHVLGANQPQIPQRNSNERNNNNELGNKGGNKGQNQVVPTTRPAPVRGKQEEKSETGEQVPVLPTTKPSNPNPSGPVNNATPYPGKNKPSPLTSSASESPPEGENKPTSSKSAEAQNGNSHPLTTSPESKSPAPHENMSGSPAESKNKPTPNPAAAGSPASGKISSEKPKESLKPTQQPPVVLCQIICGPNCCSVSSKPTTKKSTIPTSKTSAPPTRAKSKKPTTEPVPEVIAGPPIAFPYPHRPGWFPHGTPSIPQQPIPILPSPLSAALDSPSESVSSSMQLPMYMTLPPATASPQISSHQGRNHPLFVGKECVRNKCLLLTEFEGVRTISYRPSFSLLTYKSKGEKPRKRIQFSDAPLRKTRSI